MKHADKSSARPWLAPLAAALLAGCNQEPQAIQARSLPFDTRSAAPNEVPYAEGVGGTLGYRGGCLFVTSPGGGETGLVMPDRFELNADTLSNGHVSYKLGEHVSFSAGFLSREQAAALNCKTPTVAMVVNSFPTEPPPAPYSEEEQD
ncbi:hypothetical protein GRI55_01575 [Erythrobacter citreus]|uniref:Uncharacterized protein n=1 Tax=Qipengyuania citrea TaxID=225971 RepID=A0A6I4U9P4_9SPHN|nr:hypothetical protein [Qipengyuania citrea]MDQ0566094.1 hypothetical protein [Qipengyuania citrea]MXP34457.1 hypothetical protein [Qipengyuania citrea]